MWLLVTQDRTATSTVSVQECFDEPSHSDLALFLRSAPLSNEVRVTKVEVEASVWDTIKNRGERICG